MDRLQLVVHGLSWCLHHGHPVLILRGAETNLFAWVSMAPEDAEAMAPATGQRPRSKARAYELIERVIDRLGGQLRQVTLWPGPDAVLQAELELAGPLGPAPVRAHCIDAIVLAWRQGCPIWIDRGVMEALAGPPAADTEASASAPDSPDAHQNPFRQFIASLEIDLPEPPSTRHERGNESR